MWVKNSSLVLIIECDGLLGSYQVDCGKAAQIPLTLASISATTLSSTSEMLGIHCLSNNIFLQKGNRLFKRIMVSDART